MSEPADGSKPARPFWQPFTFKGLAVVAEGGASGVLVAELVTAMLLSAVVVWFFQRAYSPVILDLTQQIPGTARIVNGHLTNMDSTLVAGSKFLAVAVTPDPGVPIGQSADLQVQFRPTNFRVGCIFRPDWGLEYDYPAGKDVEISRAALEPRWEAWRPVVLAAIATSVCLWLLVSWLVLAFFYTPFAKFFAWLTDRSLAWGQAWNLTSGALLPGACLMGLGILLYAWRGIDLVGLVFIWMAHLVMGWILCTGGVLARPMGIPEAVKRNPFDH